MNVLKPQVDVSTFMALDIMVGTIVDAQWNSKAIKPAYILDIDFGTDVGIKKGSAQITQAHNIEDLLGTQIVAVVNFPPRRVAGIKSEVLVLAAVNGKNGAVLLSPTQPVENGDPVS